MKRFACIVVVVWVVAWPRHCLDCSGHASGEDLPSSPTESWVVVRTRMIDRSDSFVVATLDKVEQIIFEEFPGSIRAAIGTNGKYLFASTRSNFAQIRKRIRDLQLKANEGASFTASFKLVEVNPRSLMRRFQRAFPEATVDADANTNTLYVRASEANRNKIEEFIVNVRVSSEL